MTEEMRRAGPLFGRIGQAFAFAQSLGGLVSLLSHFKDATKALDLITAYAAVEDPWTTAGGLKARLLIVCDLIDIAAPQTATTLDDAAVAQLRSLAANDAMLGVVAGVLARFFAQVPTATPAAFHEFLNQPAVLQSVHEAAVENQFDMGALLQIFDLLMKLFAVIKSMAPLPAPAAGQPDAAKPKDPFGQF
jgi:hypothetical protein